MPPKNDPSTTPKKASKPRKVEAPESAHATPKEVTDSDARFGRLERIEIRNLRGIGRKGVEIQLDQLVALVGENNLGKSTILWAYELISDKGSGGGTLDIDDFPDRGVPQQEGEPVLPERFDQEFPQVILDTIVTSPKGKVGKEYALDLGGEKGFLVRERWIWRAPGKVPERTGYKWGEIEPRDQTGRYEGEPSGFAAVAAKRRPIPFRLSAFAQSSELEKQIVDLFMEAIKKSLKEAKKNPANGFADVLARLTEARDAYLAGMNDVIEGIERELSSELSRVFPGYRVGVDRKQDSSSPYDPTSLFNGAEPSLRMGYGTVLSPLNRQGSGAQRALMWTALRLLAHRKTTAGDDERPRLLLIDEPELCLHPSSIRLASDVLYDLAKPGSGWQVMLTTHSPLFLDLGRDHTTIVRLERFDEGTRAVRVFRSDDEAFKDEDGKELDFGGQLKLLNAYDPYVGEFFFGGRTIVVEGDTEYAVFRRLVADDADFANVHVVRARGKPNLLLLATILNQFKATYAVLHDADRPKNKNGGTNGMWTVNVKLLVRTSAEEGRTVRRVASIRNFESALFGMDGWNDDKPTEAIGRIEADPAKKAVVKQLLRCLLGEDPMTSLPPNFLAWRDEAELRAAVEASEPKAA